MVFQAPTVLATRYDWLASDEPSFFEMGRSEQDMPSPPHPIPEEVGACRFQAMHLPLNQVIRKGVFTFKPETYGKLFPLAKITEHFTEPVLCVQAVNKGRVIISDHQSGRDFMVSNNSTLFMHADYRHNSASLDTSEDIDMTILIIARSVLSKLIGEEQASFFLKGLGVEIAPVSTVNKTPHYIENILHSCIDDRLTGNIAKLHAQSKVLEYICWLYKYVAPETQQEPPKRDIQELMTQVHDDLVRLEGKLPAIPSLAKQYGLSHKQLNQEFRNKYGKSLYNYITDIRLNDAHRALKKTDIPMKNISKNLGYSHVNHFITAFRKQFGYPPGSIRKQNG